MTSNAIAYQKYLEDQRHNLETEAQGRQNIELGKVNAQTAQNQVALGYSNLYELNRSNLANEAIKEGQLAVSQQQVDVQSGQLELAQNMAWPNLLGSIVGKFLPAAAGYVLGSNSGGSNSTTNVEWRLNGVPTGIYNEFGM